MNFEYNIFNFTKDEWNFESIIQTILKEKKIMEETLVIDRIENNIAICENRENGIIIEIDVSKLPDNIREGSVIKYMDGNYRLDLEEQKNIEARIAEKMKNIWNN